MKLLTIDTASDLPVYQQITDQVRALVRDGALPPETALPSVRQLAADLELNPNTIARAYTMLEQQGILRTVRRRGTFVADGGPDSAVHATDRRLDEAIDRVIEQAGHLNLGSRELLEAMERKLTGERVDHPSGGEGT